MFQIINLIKHKIKHKISFLI